MLFSRTFVVLFFVLLFLACGKSEKSIGEPRENEEALEDKSGNVPANALTFQVRPSMIGFSNTQEEKIRQAAALIKRVIASPEFKKRVLNHYYNGKRTFVDNDGLTNFQIYQKILAGREMMTGLGRNNTMDLEIELYTDLDSNTIGYTYPDVVRIYMNSKYFNRFRPYQVADNMMHEWLHKLGFGHDVQASPERPHSVPYAVGYIVRDLARKLSKNSPKGI